MSGSHLWAYLSVPNSPARQSKIFVATESGQTKFNGLRRTRCLKTEIGDAVAYILFSVFFDLYRTVDSQMNAMPSKRLADTSSVNSSRFRNQPFTFHCTKQLAASITIN